MRLLLAKSAAAAVMLSGLAIAQVRGQAVFTNPLSAPQMVTPGFATFGIPRPSGIPTPIQQRPFFGGPFLFFSDWGYEPAPPPSVSVVVVPASAPAPAAAEEPRSSMKPLLLEFQGDHWVQVDHFQTDTVPTSNKKQESARAQKPAPATLLVFRNGHEEATSSFVIIGNALYAKSDYWTAGTWTKKIPLADLDLAATARANQEHGVAFTLPSSPNEIIVRF